MRGVSTISLAKIYNLIIFLILVSANILFGQISDYISSVKVNETTSGQPVPITVQLFQSSTISQIILSYKSFGETEFEKIEMDVTGLTASAVIPADKITAPFLEYFFTIFTSDGKVETFPENVLQGNNPFQLIIKDQSPKDSEIMILSPEPESLISPDELIISVSLLRASDIISDSKTKLFLDNIDVSSKAVFSDDLILLSAENIPFKLNPGKHFLRVEVYDLKGRLYHSITRGFDITQTRLSSSIPGRLKYNMDFLGETRNEQFNNNITWYNNINGNIRGEYDDWRFRGRVYVTSEEKNYLQPQNRYSVSIENDWLKLEAGDSYPRYSKLIMDGKRLRGISGGIYLGFFNLQASYGQIDRATDGRLVEKLDTLLLESNVVDIDSAKYGSKYGRVIFGKFKRNLLAVRPSFGDGNNFQLGFTYLHSKDEVQSIEFGTRPQENALVGTDLMASADNRRVLLTAEAAVNLTNKDITNGTLSDAQIDSIFGSGNFFDTNPSDIKNIKNALGNFITVNQFITPLNPEKLSSFAAETALQLNYFNNTFKATYLYRGNDYQSFGQSFLRTDIKGLNLIDRFRVVDNKLFVSLGYEKLEDNLQKTKIATTDFQTMTSSVSYYPRNDLPNITFGFSRYINSNGLKKFGPDSSFTIDDATNRYLFQVSYNIKGKVQHNTYFSVSASNREDNSIRNSDGHNFNTSLMINSNWTNHFISHFSLVYFSSEYSSLNNEYVTLSIGGRYRLINDKLELALTLSPSFGDFKRQTFEFVTTYNAMEKLRFMFQARIYRVPDSSTNSIVGLTAQWNI